MTGKKNAAFSKDHSVNDMKKIGHKLGVTINDLLMCITSISLKEYMIKMGDTKTKQVKLSVPFSLREPPKTVEEFKLKNSFALLTVPLELYSD